MVEKKNIKRKLSSYYEIQQLNENIILEQETKIAELEKELDEIKGIDYTNEEINSLKEKNKKLEEIINKIHGSVNEYMDY